MTPHTEDDALPLEPDRHEKDAPALSEEAIYAALIWLRNHANSVARPDDLRGKIKLTHKQREEIYPNQAESVELGLKIGRSLIYGHVFYSDGFPYTSADDPVSNAVRRFVASQS